MDADRKSTVSSYHGGRKSSQDALNSPSSPPTGEVSSFLDPNRNTSAGYNRTSFLHTGREEPIKGGYDEEQGLSTFDIYADFNNAGPRYSAAIPNTQGYQQLKQPLAPQADNPSNKGPVEIVTVPALGPEWAKSELRDMTSTAKREKKQAARAETWKLWKRDQKGLCGGWLTRRLLVFGLFGLCAAIGIILAFTLPRIPSYTLNANTPLSRATGSFGDSIPVAFSRFPANFSFPAYAELQLNTQDNFLPLTFLHLRAQVFDLDSNRLVGSGDLGKKTVPAKSFPQIQLPLNFTYIASNDTDQTWKNWYAACKNRRLYADGERPPLRFNLVLNADISGRPGNHAASTEMTSAPCPVELPMNSV